MFLLDTAAKLYFNWLLCWNGFFVPIDRLLATVRELGKFDPIGVVKGIKLNSIGRNVGIGSNFLHIGRCGKGWTFMHFYWPQNPTEGMHLSFWPMWKRPQNHVK